MDDPDLTRVEPKTTAITPLQAAFVEALRLSAGCSSAADATRFFPLLNSIAADLAGFPETSPPYNTLSLSALKAGGEFTRTGRTLGLDLTQLFVLACQLRDFFLRHGETYGCAAHVEPASIMSTYFDAFLRGVATESAHLQGIDFHKKLREANRFVLQERRRYYSIFKRMAEPACIIDRNLRLLETNRAFDSFFQISGKAHIGKNCYEVLGEEFRAACVFDDFLHDQRGLSCVEMDLLVHGEPRSIIVNGTFLGDINHESSGGIVILQDITSRRLVEQALRDSERQYRFRLAELVDERTVELQTANQQLKREIAIRRQTELSLRDLTTRLSHSNQELDQFAHVASHDLKEPLMLIMAFSERLIKKHSANLDDKAHEYLHRIRAAAEHMRQLIEGFLSLSQVTSGARPYEDVDLTDLVQEVLQSLEERIKESHARIEIGQLGRLGGDRVQLRQLFQNIIANALKYRKTEGEPLVVLQGSLGDDNYYEIVIQDNGIGFDPQDAERIFRPLERLHSRHEYEGTGMGLTTCQKIVARHGGEISARSEVGQGATFIIRLPTGLLK